MPYLKFDVMCPVCNAEHEMIVPPIEQTIKCCVCGTYVTIKLNQNTRKIIIHAFRSENLN